MMATCTASEPVLLMLPIVVAPVALHTGPVITCSSGSLTMSTARSNRSLALLDH